MKKVINPVTGNDEYEFQATLISVSADVVGSTPNNNRDYRVGSCGFKNKAGQTVQRSCLIFEANYAYGMKEGVEYNTRAIIEKGRETPLLVMSHLTASSRATFEDFGEDTAILSKAVEAVELTKIKA